MAAPIVFTGSPFAAFQTTWINIDHGAVLDPTLNNGSVALSASADSVTLNGPDALGVNGDLNSQFSSAIVWSTTISAAGTIAFHFDYSTSDFSPSVDQAGVWVTSFAGANDPNGFLTFSDGVQPPAGFFPLLSSGIGDFNQSGTFSVAVSPGDTFGFFMNSIDNLGGAASLIITGVDFTAAPPAGGGGTVPEPGTALLLIPGVAVLAVRLRRRA
ncbi:MAG: hypothetical protein LAP87_11555 [Acidobacteriia bacterium]|nr:hypothetical protein [Terriglobia bacterium]